MESDERKPIPWEGSSHLSKEAAEESKTSARSDKWRIVVNDESVDWGMGSDVGWWILSEAGTREVTGAELWWMTKTLSEAWDGMLDDRFSEWCRRIANRYTVLTVQALHLRVQNSISTTRQSSQLGLFSALMLQSHIILLHAIRYTVILNTDTLSVIVIPSQTFS